MPVDLLAYGEFFFMKAFANRKHLPYMASFFIPFVILVLAMAACQIYPFGKYDSFISDANGYYINYISYWKRVLNGQESILYSFTKGIGGSTSGLIAYHLLNPFMILFALFDLTDFPLVYTLVMLLTISSCGLTMYIFLNGITKGSDGSKLWQLIFSTSYALMGYNAVNSWQLQWLTGVMLLPLVILGVYRICNGKSCAMYVITLALSLISNFYIGYMVTTAAFLIFIALSICQKQKKHIFRYIAATFTGGFLSSFIWLPALLSLLGGRAGETSVSTFSFTETGKILGIASKLFTGMHSTSELKDGLPVIFCGIFSLILCILFFLDGRNEKRKRLAAGTILGIYALSFYVNTLSVILQGFSYTAWFNFRYSFIFSFIIITIAAMEFPKFLTVPKKNIVQMLVIMAVAAVLIFSQELEFAEKPYWLIDIVILLLICGALYLYRTKPESNGNRVFAMVLILLVGINLYANDVTSTMQVKDWFTEYADTSGGIANKEVYSEYITNSDDSFYRMESEINRSGAIGLDLMMFDYNGVSLSGSVEKTFVKQGLMKLGVQWYANRNYYSAGMSASMDSLLGIKYMISSRDLTEEKGYKLLNSVTGVNFYQNPYVLPIGMLATSSVDGLSDEIDATNDVFAIQNLIWSSITGRTENLYSEETDISYTSHNESDSQTVKSADEGSIEESEADMTSASMSAVWSEMGLDSMLADLSDTSQLDASESYVEVSFTASYDGPYYLYAYGYVDAEYGSSIDPLKYIGNYKNGETVTSKIPLSGTITKSILEATVKNTYVACLDTELLEEYSGLIQGQDLSIEKDSSDDSKIWGSFSAEEDQKLFFTIPYDKGWTLYVDGVKTELSKTAGLFMSADVSAGEHTYELKFFPEGLTTGIIAGIASLFIFAALLITEKKKVSDHDLPLPLEKCQEPA